MEQLKDDMLGFILLFVFVIGWIEIFMTDVYKITLAWIFGVQQIMENTAAQTAASDQRTCLVIHGGH